MTVARRVNESLRSCPLMRNTRSAPLLLRTLASCLVLPVLVAGACAHETKTPGQLVVAVGTDMALPEQIDTIELEVSVNGRTLLDIPMPTGTDAFAQPIPATLTLVEGPDPSLPATIRVVGLRNGVARTLRQVVTTIPTEGTALLRHRHPTYRGIGQPRIGTPRRARGRFGPWRNERSAIRYHPPWRPRDSRALRQAPQQRLDRRPSDARSRFSQSFSGMLARSRVLAAAVEARTETDGQGVAFLPGPSRGCTRRRVI